MRRLALLLVFAASTACDRPSTGGTPPAASTPRATSSVVTGPAAAIASAAPTSSTPGATRPWHGTYKSAASTLTVPPDWNKVHWSDTQSTAGIGEGTMTLLVDAGGHVSGAVDGPLGPAVLDGMITDGKLTATVRRKDPADRGFAGTLVGSLSGDRGEGTMNVSLGLASALRTATFTLSPGDGGGAAH